MLTGLCWVLMVLTDLNRRRVWARKPLPEDSSAKEKEIKKE